MVSANELRIGNLVYDDLSEKYIQIKGIGKKEGGHEAAIGVWFDDNSWTAINDDEEVFDFIEGIRLTPEWFEKLDFESIGKTFLSKFNHTIVQGWDSEQCVFYYQEPIFKLRLDYVHQLQNLYFALTGQELCATT